MVFKPFKNFKSIYYGTCYGYLNDAEMIVILKFYTVGRIK